MHPDFKKYLPDTWTAEKKTERDFFWTILVTLKADYVERLVNECRQARAAANAARFAAPRRV